MPILLQPIRQINPENVEIGRQKIIHCNSVSEITRPRSFISGNTLITLVWAKRAPPSLIGYFICRYTTSSLIFCNKPYEDVNKALYLEWPCIIEVLGFFLLQVVTPTLDSFIRHLY
jgi:hypothetical protein